MPGISLCKILLHVRLCEMVIEMFFTLPLFNKMKDPGNGNIAEKLIPATSGFPADERDDLPDLPGKIVEPFW